MTALTLMHKRWARALLAAALATATATHAQLLSEPPRGEAVERHRPGEIKPTQWVHDPTHLATQVGDAVGVAEIPDSTVNELRQICYSTKRRALSRSHGTAS